MPAFLGGARLSSPQLPARETNRRYLNGVSEAQETK